MCAVGTADDGTNTCTDCDDGYVSDNCMYRRVQQESMMMVTMCTDCDDGYVSTSGVTVCTMFNANRG